MNERDHIHVLELRSVRGTGGGPEKTILYGAAQASPRFNVTVCYVRDTRDSTFNLGERARDLGVQYVEVEERHSLDLGIITSLTDMIRDLKIDIVHAHEYKTDMLALWLARRTSVVPLATAHGWTGHSLKERYLYYPADKWLLARYPRVIAVSTDIKNQLVRYGARPENVSVILNSIDPAVFTRIPERRTAMRTRLRCPDDVTLVGAVGRVEPQKRFDLLIDAMVPILQARPRTRLVIAGDGSLLADLRKQAASLGVCKQIEFLGHRQDVADLHQALDVFVQSSEYEGTPNAVLEAMAMETALVATDAGGTAELMEDGLHGLLVPCRDVPALRAAVQAVLDDPRGAAGRTAAARARVEKELSFARRTQRLEEIYAELVDA